MLNIGRLSPDAAEYYIGEVATSAENYYTGRGESEGRWVGSLADTLGLSGSVAPEDFRAVLDGRHPKTGERLVRSRTGAPRAVSLVGPNQASLFDGDTLDVARVAARLKVSSGRVWQLLWAGQRAAVTPDSRPSRYLTGTKVPRADHRGETWLVPRAEVERYEAVHRAAKARPGYDLTLRPPKSVSLLWALGDADQRQSIRQAHREAVDAVVDYVEHHALYARRGKGDRGKVETDGVAAAAFDHRTSRAGDPLLHTHVVTANLTRTIEGSWQAIDGRPLFDHARPAGFLYQAHLRHLLSHRLGLRWEPVRNGWAEIEGVPDTVIRAFSKRRDEIEEMVAEAGYSSARAHQSATLATRSAKEYGVDPETLEGRWRAEAEGLGFGPEQVSACFGRELAASSPDATALFADLAGPEGLTAQASTFRRKDVIEAISERAGAAVGAARIEELTDAFISSRHVAALAQGSNNVELVHRRGGCRERSQDLARFTTPELLELERSLIAWTTEGFGHEVPVARRDAVERALAARPSLSDEQIDMVRRVCSSDAPAIQLVAGRPGAGKTYATAACVEAFVSSGVPVVGCALSATAAAELESATNLQVLSGAPARTIARLMLDIDRHGLPHGSVLLVDEASMVGTRDLAALALRVQAAGGAIKLIGDPDQHGPVDAGGLFTAFARNEKAGVVRLIANNRQLDPTERAAVEEFRQGGVTAALARLEETGRIVKSPNATASYHAIVEEWWQGTEAGSHDPMIAGPNRVRGELNHLARRRFATEGRLGTEILRAGRREFATGDWVVAKRNDRRLTSTSGDFVKNGSAGVVAAVDPDREVLVVDFHKEGRITLPITYLSEGGLDYGYARTTYGVQGATLDRTLYHASDQSSFEEGYVALTRGRYQARLYIVDGTALHDDESAHRGHDREPTGLDTVTEAMGRRRAKRLVHQDDHAASAVASAFSGWTLRQLAEERRGLQRILADAPADVNPALAAASRQLDALRTRRQAWLDALGSGGGSRGESGRQKAAILDTAIAATEQRVSALRRKWATRRAFLDEHNAEVERLELVRSAERTAELKVRTMATVNPPSALLDAVGRRPDGYIAAQRWRNAVEDAAVYLERFGTSEERPAESEVEGILGPRPTDVEAGWLYRRAAASLEAAATSEVSASAAPELGVE
ncbi:MAG: MobF family relaxase [Acidimicrobiales bacterium]